MATTAKLRAALPLLLVMVALGTVALPSATSSSACDLYASPTGSNAASGSFRTPFRTVPHLISRLSAAQPTGCLRGYPDGGPAAKSGLYELDTALVISKPGISLRSADGQVAQIKGPISITSDEVTLSGLVLDNRLNDSKLASPVIDGSRVKLIDNDITSRGGSHCVTVRQDAQGVEIRHNRIHNCANGVRLAHSRFAVVEANLIYRNIAGVSVFPDADNSSVVRNIIDRNGDNVVIGGDAASPSIRSDRNDVFQNITSNPKRFNLTDHDGTMGDGNLFRSNCVYKAGDPANGIDDVTSSSPVSGRALASQTTFGDPRYVATRGPNAHRLQGSSPCNTLGGVAVDFAAAASDDWRPSQVEAINLRPNIVFIVTDDQRADTMHMTPHVMPNVLKWFRDGDPAAGVVGGTEYVNGFATTPVCCPARSSIFSGRYVHNHEVTRNALGRKLLSTATIQRYLNDIGYENAIFGKYLNGWKQDQNCPACTNRHDDAPGAGPAPNFDQYSIFEGYNANYLNISPGLVPPGPDEYTPDYIFDRAQDFVQGREGSGDGRPWFLYLAPGSPHASFAPKYGPDAWKQMLAGNRLGVNENTPVPAYSPELEGSNVSKKPRYVREWGARDPQFPDTTVVFESPGLPGLQKQQLRSLMPVDDGIDRLFTKLEATGEADDTLAVFISDNGYQWREHAVEGGDCVNSAGQSRGTPCGPSSKSKPYRESVKVPFYVRWPANPNVGASPTATKMVANVDLAPTVMDVIDAEPSGAADQPVMDGWSLFNARQRTYLLTENTAGDGRIFPGWRALRTNTELYVSYFDDVLTPENDAGFQEYYSLASDPAEHVNLMGANGRRDPGEPSLGALPALLDLYGNCVGRAGVPDQGKYPCP